jgi:hypothetical protein
VFSLAQTNRAIADYTKAVELNPKMFSKRYVNRGTAYYRKS